MIQKTQQVLAAAAADATSTPFECLGMATLTATVIVSVTSADLQAVLTFQGTSADTGDSAFPANTSLAASTPLPTGFTFDAATGTITANNPGVGTHEISVHFARVLRWARCLWDYTSGGGTVNAKVTLSGWSIG